MFKYFLLLNPSPSMCFPLDIDTHCLWTDFGNKNTYFQVFRSQSFQIVVKLQNDEVWHLVLYPAIRIPTFDQGSIIIHTKFGIRPPSFCGVEGGRNCIT